jgi:hypothetical protein
MVSNDNTTKIHHLSLFFFLENQLKLLITIIINKINNYQLLVPHPQPHHHTENHHQKDDQLENHQESLDIPDKTQDNKDIGIIAELLGYINTTDVFIKLIIIHKSIKFQESIVLFNSCIKGVTFFKNSVSKPNATA